LHNFTKDLVFTTQFLPSTATVVWTIPSGWTASYSGSGNSICTITNVTDSSTKTITATVTTVKGSSTDSYEYVFQDCDEGGCPPVCRFELDDMNGQNYFIYPNPSTTTITIYSKQPNQQSVYKVYNTQGTLVLDGEILSENHAIDINKLPNGFYFLYLQYNNRTELFKLIIE